MTDAPIDTSEVSMKGHLIIIDDDEVLCTRLAKAMEKRGYSVRTAFTVADGIKVAKEFEPEFAVVDLRLADGNGLEVVDQLREIVEDCRIIMMTAYGNIATAVAAVKAGAIDYLAKPADADMIEKAISMYATVFMNQLYTKLEYMYRVLLRSY